MAKRCIPCLGTAIKQAILKQVKDSAVAAALERIPDCEAPLGISVCGSMRGRSGYQQFISSCMKAKGIQSFGQAPQAMRECAGEWRQKKGHA